jgi:hypothetical protein
LLPSERAAIYGRKKIERLPFLAPQARAQPKAERAKKDQHSGARKEILAKGRP